MRTIGMVRVPGRSGTRRLTAVAAVLVLGGAAGAFPSAAFASPTPVWARQDPASHPRAGAAGAMTFDAATGTVVMFGGDNSKDIDSDATWTWDGSTWTKQAPAAHPAPREGASMAYDAATGSTVVFGGDNLRNVLSDTWAWDGSTWTKQAGTHPSARVFAPMAYDAATGTAVLFGGTVPGNELDDTWTWG
jgi:hypothetical protein